jgi:TPR repeat protein
MALPAALHAQDDVVQLQRDCDAGKAQACVDLGDLQVSDFPLADDDWRRAASFYERGCNLGDGKGCRDLGRISEHGYGGAPQDRARAASLYQQACDLGQASGCEMGAELTATAGFLPDSTRYRGFLKKGCDLGRGRLCYPLALMYDIGYWVPKDTARANELFKKGCLFEHEESCGMVRR